MPKIAAMWHLGSNEQVRAQTDAGVGGEDLLGERIDQVMSKRVLLAEDEPNIVESLTFLLDRAGFEVTVETDGRQALETALDTVPDVLILDVMLPELDGYEVLRRLRSDQRTIELPVVMLTAKGQREDRETALACGADLFIKKPFANADIIAAVKQLAEGRPDG